MMLIRSVSKCEVTNKPKKGGKEQINTLND